MLHRIIVAAAGATLITGCSDAPVPTAPSLSPRTLRIDIPAFDIKGTIVPLSNANDTTYATFVVRPDVKEMFVFDRHNGIQFGASAICEPNVSTYGPTEWEKDCVPTTRPITIYVKRYLTASGHPRVDFEPALRFNPRSAGVHLYIEDVDDGTPLWFKDILYCDDANRCIDESRNDSSLQTRPDPHNGLLARRIRHFSGYMVSVGFGAEAQL